MLVLVPLALFGVAYFLSLFFRSINAILAPALEQGLGLDGSTLGLLTAAYFLGLGVVQVPVGICLDAYGPGRVQGVLLTVAASGIALFAWSTSVTVLTVARGMIGVGLSGCLMASFHAATLWLRQENVPFANGFYLAAGGLGALFATGPAEYAFRLVDWRVLFACVAVATLLLGLGLWATAPPVTRKESCTWRERISGLGAVWANERLRRYLPLTALCFGTGAAMQGLWTASWLRDVAGYGNGGIAGALTLMAVALTIGSALSGTISKIVERRGMDLRDVIHGSALIFVLAEIGLLTAPVSVAIVCWAGMALAYNPITLSYALVARGLPMEYAGRSNTVMNTVVIGCTFLIQYLVGVGLSLLDGGDGQGYSEAAYSVVFCVLVSIQCIALLWCLRDRRVAPDRAVGESLRK